ncbi:hypothetical protein Peur_016425 [Populus x canadensis]
MELEVFLEMLLLFLSRLFLAHHASIFDAPPPTVQGGDLPMHRKNEAFARCVGLHVKHIRCIGKTKECKAASISWIEKSSKRSWSFQKNGNLGDCRSEILKAFMP